MPGVCALIGLRMENLMKAVTRRGFFGMTAAGAALAASPRIPATESRSEDLRALTTDAKPIGTEEHAARIAKAQSLM